MGEISQSDLVAGEVLVLREDLLVTGELALESTLELDDAGSVGFTTEHGAKHKLVGKAGDVRVEVEGLYRGGSLEEGTLLRIGGEEARAGLAGDVAGDGPRLVDDEAVVVL
jgi:hypothetical protein